tara:strand:- start:470 stop:691 length:222 start_codon:yes stop_codon:yes gene_type:complete
LFEVDAADLFPSNSGRTSPSYSYSNVSGVTKIFVRNNIYNAEWEIEKKETEKRRTCYIIVKQERRFEHLHRAF